MKKLMTLMLAVPLFGGCDQDESNATPDTDPAGGGKADAIDDLCDNLQTTLGDATSADRAVTLYEVPPQEVVCATDDAALATELRAMSVWYECSQGDASLGYEERAVVHGTSWVSENGQFVAASTMDEVITRVSGTSATVEYRNETGDAAASAISGEIELAPNGYFVTGYADDACAVAAADGKTCQVEFAARLERPQATPDSISISGGSLVVVSAGGVEEGQYPIEMQFSSTPPTIDRSSCS